MLTIVMAYYQRQFQLTRTLLSLCRYDNFEVVIVDDCSPDDIVLPELPFKVTVIKLKQKYSNASWVFNTGFKYAIEKGAGIILIQNSECYHKGDILSRARNVKNDEYISFGCFSLTKELTFKDNIDLQKLITENNHVAVLGKTGWNESCGWYNHPVYDPVAFHHCCAITAENLIKLNGFDERFSFGIGYEDDYFVRQIRNLGLRIEITADPIVVHQWHENPAYYDNTAQLWEINRLKILELIPKNEYRAKHILTPDLCGI